MNTPVSRRAFLTAGGGLVALASAAIFWSSGASSTRARLQTDRPALDRYVDHNGWMLTAADKKKISERQLVTYVGQTSRLQPTSGAGASG
jgi:hypothetical protein